MKTLEDMLVILREEFDVEEVCYMLDITSEELLSRFDDLAGNRIDFIRNELESLGY